MEHCSRKPGSQQKDLDVPLVRPQTFTTTQRYNQHMKEKTTKKEEKALLLAWQKMHRKIRIIEWLVPRIHKGISDPRNYEKLLGRVDPTSHKPRQHTKAD